MPNLLNIAMSGLLTHQRALSTTGHNIANATTEGYSRQININSTRPAEFLGGSYLGAGVDLSGVQRVVDQFAITQLRNDTSAFQQADLVRSYLDRLDSLFADSSTGLTSSQDKFFSAMQAVNDSPTSIVARQVFLAESQNLVNRFHSIATQVSNQALTVNQLIQTATTEVSDLAEQIASLNQTISEQSGSGLGQLPNDLLDQRDRLIKDLSKLVGISTTVQANGAVNIFIGSGQAIVLNGEAMQLVSGPSDVDPRKTQLAIQSNSSVIKLGNQLQGGVLGGLLQVRDGALGEAVNSLGRIALAISGAVNQQHRLGMDLEGQLGGDLFTDINSAAAIASRTVSAGTNSVPSDQVVAVSIADLSGLTISDYRLTFTSATDYVLTRLSDGQSNAGIDPALSGSIAGLPASLQFDGLSVALDRPSGNFAAGDSFVLQPTSNAAHEIGVVLNRPEQIALASPIRTESNINNQGTGVIASGTVTDTSQPLFSTTAGQLSPPLIIRFTSATTYDILDNSGPAPVPLAPPQSGLSFPPVPANSLLPSGFGIELEITGDPQSGDTFSIAYNSSGFQDSRNGLAMASLQTATVLNNGLTSLQGAYGQLLQGVGVAASQARFSAETSETLLQQSQARRDEMSGVNLDEEAAKLIELEQAYNASAQVINIARTLFDTLINAVGG